MTNVASNRSCSKSDTLVVKVIGPPVANAGLDTTVCQSNSSIQLYGLPAGGIWSRSTFITASGVFKPSTSGTYTLIYTIGAGTCVGKDTMVVSVLGGYN